MSHYMADNVHIAFEPQGYSAPSSSPLNLRNADGELGHGGSSKLLLVLASLLLIPTAAQADLKNDTEMWNMYMDEVKEEDDRITDAWKDDANSIVTFVSHNLSGPCVHPVDELQDGSFLRNCWRIHHRILQNVIL